MTGAGFAIPWGGPKTNELTDFIRRTGFKNRVGNFINDEIYKWLVEDLKVPSGNVNFETILNVIEDFIQFWSSSKGSSSNGLTPFISKNDEKWSVFFGFELENEKNGNVDVIPITHDQFVLERLRNVPFNQKEVRFLEILYLNSLSILAGKISSYSYFTKTLDKIGDSELLKKSVNYFKFKSSQNFLRIYTLNYDRILQRIFDSGQIPAFQGFKTEEIIPSKYHSGFDPIGIHTRTGENCIYHLHGSVFWEIESQNGDVEYFLTYGPVVPDVSNANLNQNLTEFYEIEKNRRLVLSSIITGYQKTLRTSVSPFRQMIAAFDRDCLTCDELIIVGYSFGDLHINDIIINSLKQNSKCNVIIIDISEHVVLDFLKNNSQKWKPDAYAWGYIKEKLKGKIFQYTRAQFFHFKMGIEEYFEFTPDEIENFLN